MCVNIFLYMYISIQIFRYINIHIPKMVKHMFWGEIPQAAKPCMLFVRQVALGWLGPSSNDNL